MNKLFIGTAMTFSLLFGTVACGGGGGGSCKTLANKLCEGKDKAHCEKTAKWLDSQMTGPDGKKLSSKEANEGCKMIMGDKDSLAAYKKQAEKKVK